MQTLSINQLAGQILGNYRIERFLGQGRLNAIYLARNLAEQRLDALTFYIVPEHFSSESRTRFLLRFRKEATAITSLDHPHVLPVYDHGDLAGNPYLVTPYMMHGSLVDLLKRHGKYDHSSILPILEQLVSGLAYAYRSGFIHGTLRPSTVVLSPENALRVAGFGLMHILQLGGIESSERTDTPYPHLLSIAGTFLVTPEYVAPEVVQGQSIDVRSDIYALGCMLFELLSGHPPFTGKDPLEIINKHVTEPIPLLHMQNPEVPIALTSVVNQSLERDPARRFQHVLELVEAFRQASRGATSYVVPGTKRQTKVLKQTEFLQDSSQDTYSSNKWQLVPPIVTGKHATVRLPEQALVSEMPTQSINADRSRAVPPIASGQSPTVISGKVPAVSASVPPKENPSLSSEQEAISEMPTQSVNTGPWRTVRPIAASQPPAATSDKFPSVSSFAQQAEKATFMPEQEAISEMPTQSVNTGSWRTVRSIAANQPPATVSGKFPSVLSSAPQANNMTSVPEQTLNLVMPNIPPLPSQKKEFPVKQAKSASLASELQSGKVQSIPGSAKDGSSLVEAYSWWSQPGVVSSPGPQTKRTELDRPETPREALRLADSGTVKWGDDSSIPYPLSTKFASAQPKIKRRRAIALLAAGGVGVAVGIAALNLSTLQHLLGLAPNQAQTQPNATGELVQSQTHLTKNDIPQKPEHLGIVIGHTTLGLNSASTFTNPADGQSSLLIHLPDNRFVAYEKACTHEQVPVYYNPTTKELVCPAHGSIFDPAKGGAVVQGPATQPLPSAKISVNSDGTITAV